RAMEPAGRITPVAGSCRSAIRPFEATRGSGLKRSKMSRCRPRPKESMILRQLDLSKLAAAVIALAALGASGATAQAPPAPGAPPQTPCCARLEGQLTALDRGTADPTRLDQLKKLEEAANKQQYDVDQLVAQSHKVGCQGSGFFVFGGQPPQCQQINAQMQQSRANLDRTLADLERLQHSGSERDGARRGLIAALAQNNCGPQYRTQVASQPRNFFERLFGGIPPLFGNSPDAAPPTDGTILPLPDASPSSTFRTLCVRSCDGYYFPISYAATQAKFAEDEKICQRTCPAAEVTLYVHHNPGEDVSRAVSLAGKPYTELPTAFQYRKEFVASCSCRRPGDS